MFGGISRNSYRQGDEVVPLRLVVEGITDAILMALPIDLFYLYFNRGWREPILPILILEFVLLICVFALGFARLVYLIWRTGAK